MISKYPRENITKVMDILLKNYLPHEQPTLRRTSHENNPFKTLMSCLLSLRTQDKNTEIASRNLFEHVKTPDDITKINMKKLEKLIYSSGHYKKKARVLKSVSKELIERFGRKVPNNKEDLLSIKGIGPKTANIVLAFAYGKEVLPIDTHCHRIPNRFGWIKSKNPVETENDLEKILPRKYWKEFNTIIILFGKTICQPISPFCSKCLVRKYCKRVRVIRSR